MPTVSSSLYAFAFAKGAKIAAVLMHRNAIIFSYITRENITDAEAFREGVASQTYSNRFRYKRKTSRIVRVNERIFWSRLFFNSDATIDLLPMLFELIFLFNWFVLTVLHILIDCLTVSLYLNNRFRLHVEISNRCFHSCGLLIEKCTYKMFY